MAVYCKPLRDPNSNGEVSRPWRAGVVWRGKAAAVAARWLGSARRIRAAVAGEEGGAIAGAGTGSGTAANAASSASGASGASGESRVGRVASPVYDPAVVEGEGPAPRILIVDDEPSMRRVCAFALRGAGWRPETEGSSLAALQRVLGGERYDALVLDYAMPELDGLEFLRRLQALGPEVRPPVLMASAHADGATACAALGLGVWDFLAKPLTPEDLRRRVRRLLDRPAAAARGEARPQALRL
ncbi:MAG: response regulator, partial [Burkholderiales bacterium]|nr:response regulator [Opitutaceae bacterium]